MMSDRGNEMMSKATLVLALFSLSMTASAGNVCFEGGSCINDPSLTPDPSAPREPSSSSSHKAKAAAQPNVVPIITGPNGESLVIDVDKNGNLVNGSTGTVVPTAGGTISAQPASPYTAYSGIGSQCYSPGHENECVLAELCGSPTTQGACTAANAKLKALKDEAQKKADDAAKQNQPQQQPQQPPPGGGSPQQPKKDDGSKDKDKDKGQPQNGGAPQCGNGGGDEDDGKDSKGNDSGSKQEGQCNPQALRQEYDEKCGKKQEEAAKICEKPPQGDSATGMGGNSATKSGKKNAQYNGSTAGNIIDWANKCQSPAQSCVDRCSAILEKIEGPDCTDKKDQLKDIKKDTEDAKNKCDKYVEKVGQACQQAGANAQNMQDSSNQAGQSAASGMGEAMKSMMDAIKQAQQQQQQENKGQAPEVPSNALCTDYSYTRACRCNNSGSEAACGLKMPN